MGDGNAMWRDRGVYLPFEPPGLTGRFAFSGRCWELRWRDRLAWRFFALIASHDHASVVWQTFRSTRKARETRWIFREENSTEREVTEPRDIEAPSHNGRHNEAAS